MAEAENYTRHCGVICANKHCAKFIRVGEYQTPYRRAGLDVRLAQQVECPHCQESHAYTDIDVVFAEGADGTALFGRHQPERK